MLLADLMLEGSSFQRVDPVTVKEAWLTCFCHTEFLARDLQKQTEVWDPGHTDELDQLNKLVPDRGVFQRGEHKV